MLNNPHPSKHEDHRNRKTVPHIYLLSLKALGVLVLLSFYLIAVFPLKRDTTTLSLSSASMTTSSSPFEISCPRFAKGGTIPAVYTRSDGEDRSPPLKWSGVPPGAKSLALIVDDPDAPDPKAPKVRAVQYAMLCPSPRGEESEFF